jgi:hypothetical protein
VGARIFSVYSSKLGLRLTSLLYRGYQDSLPGVKRPGHGVDHLPLSIAEIIHEKNCTSTPPSMPVMSCYRATFTFIVRYFRRVQTDEYLSDDLPVQIT